MNGRKGRIGRGGRIGLPLTAAQRRTRATQAFVVVCLLFAVIGVALLVARL